MKKGAVTPTLRQNFNNAERFGGKVVSPLALDRLRAP